MGMTVDLTVRLGDILTMIGLFAGGIAVVFMQRADMRILAGRIASIEGSLVAFAEKLNGITEILVQQARHDQRISNVEQRLQAMHSDRKD